MDAESICPRPMLQSDARALIGLLAILEAEVMVSQIDTAVIDHIGRRFADEGLLVPGADDRQFRQSLSDLNHRIRFALGEYDKSPGPIAVP
jgi:hypothetical protein